MILVSETQPTKPKPFDFVFADIQMFGREAAKILPYVECFPEGVFKGTKMDKACSDVGIEGFPTWVINGEVTQSTFLCY